MPPDSAQHLPKNNLSRNDIPRKDPQKKNPKYYDHDHQLVVLDMDSTLIAQEAIDLLGHAVGRGEEMSQITEKAMAGELDFEEALKKRVEMLVGLTQKDLEKIRKQLTLTPGTQTFLKTIKSFGYHTGIVSGGFSYFVDPLAEELGIDHTLSNVLEWENGMLTGSLCPPIVDRAAKAQFLIEIANQNNIPLAKTVAIGDGANDADMLAISGLGIAFCAHPSLQEIADISINIPDLAPVLSILGHEC